MPSERVSIGRGHTEISFLWDGIYFKGAAGALFSPAFVVRREKDGRFLGPGLQCRGWNRLVSNGGFRFVIHFADHGLARGRDGWEDGDVVIVKSEWQLGRREG